MYVVWDLFGGGQNSVYNALKDNPNYDVYTFDITKPTRAHHYQVDLSQDNIVEIFKKYPKPDIIVASPLCQSFTNVLSMKGGGTCGWTYNEDNSALVLRSEEDFEKNKCGFTKSMKYDRQLFLAQLGKKCIDNTLALIDYFNPKTWYIENPSKSYLWKYLALNQKEWCHKHNLIPNSCTYGAYGYILTKPTTFASNVWLNLASKTLPKPWHFEMMNGVKYYVSNFNNYRVKSNPKCRTGSVGLRALCGKSSSTPFDTKQIKEAGQQSQIPPSLIQDIFNQFANVL